MGKIGYKSSKTRPLQALRPWSWLGLALVSASCTPNLALSGPEATASAVSLPEPQARLIAPDAAPATLGREAAPSLRVQPAATYAFRGRTALDQLRSHDCLAQAIYYEAASESEDGQRAVAQVVLNRVRHPAWPNSVCGVVYQGPLRAGGGCQFTFTCDGSLLRRPVGEAWLSARRLAAEALAGRTFAAIGLATHYHTHAVSPAWAPRLTRIGAIGAHNFYRLPGRWGRSDAFASAYTGTEPLPVPSIRLAATPAVASSFSESSTPLAAIQEVPGLSSVTAPAEDAPAQSTVREEYRHSGQWRDDAPAAITGRPAT